MADAHEHLRTGWEPDVPSGDTVLRDYLDAWARWFEHLASDGGTSERRDDLVLSDSGSPSMFANQVLLLQPVASERDAATLARHVHAFFARRPGGKYVLYSPWPTPDLRPRGFELAGHPPWMLRPPGGEPRPAPPDLRVEEVVDENLLAGWNRAVALGFPLPEVTSERVVGGGMLGAEGVHLWVGLHGDEPVATAAAHVRERLQHVEMISTRPEWRGRGYGEALTWRATLADPGKPAGLIASDDGRPIYERMGYAALTRFTLWIGTRGGAS